MDPFNDLQFMGIAIRFPSLVDAKGVMPWSPNDLDEWAAESRCDIQAVHAARFILEKWNPHFDWACGKFDIRSALECWDRSHRITFLDQVTKNLAFLT